MEDDGFSVSGLKTSRPFRTEGPLTPAAGDACLQGLMITASIYPCASCGDPLRWPCA